jgi:DNA repair exonuclease SbcCD nuclease subunit
MRADGDAGTPLPSDGKVAPRRATTADPGVGLAVTARNSAGVIPRRGVPDGVTSEPVKLIHTADLHLDSPLRSLALRDERLGSEVRTATRAALSRMVDVALEEGVRALLIAGDLFDGQVRSARTAAFLIGEFERLRAAGVDVFYIKGNHDVENPAAGAFDLPANVHVFDGRGGSVHLEGTDIRIHGVSFRERHAPESLLPRFGPPVPDAVNIGMLHTSLAGAPGHDSYAPCSVADLARHGFDYWALGHVHARAVHSEAPWVVMPGMPQGRDIGEPGPKSATLLTVADGRIAIDEVRTSAVEFRRSACDVSEAADDDAVRARLRAHLAAEAADIRSDAAILRLALVGATPRAWALRRDGDLWREIAEGLAEETGRLWIERLDLEARLPDGSGAAGGPVGELEELMAEIRGETGFREEARAEVEKAVAQLPPERRRALAGDADALSALAEELAEGGAAALIARMRGAGR